MYVLQDFTKSEQIENGPRSLEVQLSERKLTESFFDLQHGSGSSEGQIRMTFLFRRRFWIRLEHPANIPPTASQLSPQQLVQGAAGRLRLLSRVQLPQQTFSFSPACPGMLGVTSEVFTRDSVHDYIYVLEFIGMTLLMFVVRIKNGN